METKCTCLKLQLYSWHHSNKNTRRSIQVLLVAFWGSGFEVWWCGQEFLSSGSQGLEEFQLQNWNDSQEIVERFLLLRRRYFKERFIAFAGLGRFGAWISSAVCWSSSWTAGIGRARPAAALPFFFCWFVMESRYRKSPLELSFQDILADVPVAERLFLATHNPIKAQRATYKTYKLFFKNKICLQLDLCLQRSSCWSYFWVRRAECLNRMSNCSNARINW